ncbi:MAG: iron-sulfur cluster assembly scaffold protein, partial [Hyphomicrobiales bacterium]|nr:iron-sulfur cluster assembly scaffold protein [Hyphomicrobiales bacterium]
MLDDVYNSRLLALAADIPRLGRLADAQGSARAHSRLCGSTVTVDVKLRDRRIVDFAHDVKACALGQASSSLMARHAIGATLEDVAAMHAAVRAMLKEGAPAPSGRFADFAVLEPVRDYRARHASTLLTFEATEAAMRDALAKAGSEP